MTNTALILTGAGRYADPWHPFAETSARLAEITRGEGWDVSIEDNIDETLAHGIDGIDVLIINAGDPWREIDTAAAQPDAASMARLIEAGAARLDEAFSMGVSVFGFHSATSTMRDYPQIRQAFSGEWVPGHSWHPAYDQFTVHITQDPLMADLSDFDVFDERYTDLVVGDDIALLGYASDEERTYPLIWTHLFGSSRVAYDALGHDTRSFDSPGHVDVIARLLAWLGDQSDRTDA